MDSTAAHQEHPGAAPGPGHEIIDELLGNEALFVNAEVDAHGRHEKPVFGRHGSNRDGVEKMGEYGHALVASYGIGTGGETCYGIKKLIVSTDHCVKPPFTTDRFSMYKGNRCLSAFRIDGHAQAPPGLILHNYPLTR
jgi:hypothetical protein